MGVGLARRKKKGRRRVRETIKISPYGKKLTFKLTKLFCIAKSNLTVKSVAYDLIISCQIRYLSCDLGQILLMKS